MMRGRLHACDSEATKHRRSECKSCSQWSSLPVFDECRASQEKLGFHYSMCLRLANVFFITEYFVALAG